MREHIGTITQQLVRAQQQLGEIDAAAAIALFLIGLVQLDELTPVRIPIILQILGPQSVILARIDEPHDLFRHPAGFVEIQSLHDPADRAQLIFRVDDLKRLRQSGFAPMHAQQPMSDAVKGTDPQRRTRHAKQCFDAAAHLAGCLVRERHRENAVRRDILDLHQPSNAMREHARLAAARTRKHERRRQRRRHRSALLIIQPIENVGYVH